MVRNETKTLEQIDARKDTLRQLDFLQLQTFMSRFIFF